MNILAVRDRIKTIIGRNSNVIGPYAALIVLLIVCCVSSEFFRNPQNLLNIMRQVSYSGIIALGMTFVIVGGGIDLSVGSLLALSGVLAMLCMNRIDSPVQGVLLAFAVASGLGIAGGALNGTLVSVCRIPPFIATLGTLSIFRSLSLQVADAGLVSGRNELFSDFGSSYICGFPMPAVVMLALALVFWVLLGFTAYGRHVCAVGSSERVARFAGIPVNPVKFGTYLLVGATAGISAFLFSGRMNAISSTSAGLNYELDAIAAVIIGGASMSGGRGSVWGTLAGILILGMVTNALDMWGVSANLQGAVKGAVIIIAVLIQRKDN